MQVVEYPSDTYLISTDKTKHNRELIHSFLSQLSYGAQGRSVAVVEKSVKHSLCFGVYADAAQVGFASIVTDYATFAWLCDVFIVEAHRGNGLSKWSVECVTTHPEPPSSKGYLLMSGIQRSQSFTFLFCRSSLRLLIQFSVPLFFWRTSTGQWA